MAHLDLEQEDVNGYRYGLKIKLPGKPFRFGGGSKGASPTGMYRLGDFLGKGGNGTVFRCSTSAGRSIAVKFLHVLSNRHRARFDFELQVLKSLQHRGILKIEDSGALVGMKTSDGQDAEDVPFIITDAFDGNLEDHVAKHGPYQAAAVKNMSIQICEAMKIVHSSKIVHRDMKPGNLFLSGSDVVIGDFGLACTAQDEGKLRIRRPKVTGGHERVGPIEYMSPELVLYSQDESKTHPVDHRSDIFQIGAIMWFMLTGVAPRGILEMDDDPTGGKFFPIIENCLKVKPERRIQTVYELESMLREIVTEVG